MKEQYNYTTDYTKLDNKVLRFKMSIEAKGIYWYMMSKPNDWKFTIEMIAKHNDCTEAKTRKIVAELMELKLLKREFAHNEKGHRQSLYTIYDSYTMHKNIPSNEKPIFENPTLRNQKVGNQEFIYNNIIYNNNILTKEVDKESLAYQESKEKKESLEVRESKNVDFDKIDFGVPDFSKKRITKRDKYIQAIKDYRTFIVNNPNCSISEELWAEWCENVIKIGGNKVTNTALIKQLKSSLDYPQDYVVNKIEKALESGWLSPYFKKDDFERYMRLKECNNKHYPHDKSKGIAGISQYTGFGEMRIVDF